MTIVTLILKEYSMLCGLAILFVLSGCVCRSGLKGEIENPTAGLDLIALPSRPSPTGRVYEAAVFGDEEDSPVLLLHSLRGVSHETLELAEFIAEWGYRVYVPNLFRDQNLDFGVNDVRRAVKYMKQSPDWTPYSCEGLGPVVGHVLEMVTEIQQEHEERVVVIGNCLTGIIPLALLSSDAVLAGVLCQPATPLATVPEVLFRHQPKAKRQSLGISNEVLDGAVTALCKNPTKRLAGFHFSHDPMAPMERFEVLQKKLEGEGLGDRFEAYVIHPEGSSVKKWWTATKSTKVRRRWISPHSTIIKEKQSDDLIKEKQSDDLSWFYERLQEFLERS